MDARYRIDFETVEDYRRRLEAEFRDRATFEPDLAKVLDEPERRPAADLVSDTSETVGDRIVRVRVYANGTRITSNYPTEEVETPTGGDWIKPGNRAAAAAFKAGREDEYIDRMRNRYGGQW
jgi:hypothetical protein